MVIYGLGFFLLRSCIMRRTEKIFSGQSRHYAERWSNGANKPCGYEAPSHSGYHSDLPDDGTGCTAAEFEDDDSNDWEDTTPNLDRADGQNDADKASCHAETGSKSKSRNSPANTNEPVSKAAKESVAEEGSTVAKKHETRKKENKVSKDKIELRSDEQGGEKQKLSQKREEDLLAQRIVDGHVGPYEIFTGA
eukprot:CAMPEP_0183298902 /NCGR_PEP_ID=MMETSP0160_2-20130417/5776_1 /TAXON_ID=2839 ORGANISM="Odontella Sinensis, Strain Grunow 1884" /NCGR_SAMPLE_ID=MMETSP0160_2 /ASSEMBLY_ACC=CAM_ASM_000250 /LENGTH=192 /DNA_ID=CAMNT_0025461025 /DNA_START=307 /DNA_END=885 /DNA_ORIENTATION=-